MDKTGQPIPVVLVTGGGRGIGRGIAVHAARAGASVAVNYVSDAASAAETAGLCGAERGTERQVFLALQADIGSEADRRGLVAETLARFGRIDALVNNAGMAPRRRVDALETTPESMDEVLGVNLLGPYFLTQAVARHWAASGMPSALPGGYLVVNISSISAEQVSLNRAEYCISKAGLRMVTKVWAARLAEMGASVVELRPGLVETDMSAAARTKYDAMIAGGVVPQKRWGTPDDVGRGVAALLTGAFPYSTGAVIAIDGGLGIGIL